MSDRNETIKRIRTALRRRGSIAWSVTGGRGTSWGWLRIDAPPRLRTWQRVEISGSAVSYGDPVYRCANSYEVGHSMGPYLQAELRKLLGFGPEETCHYSQGCSIAAGSDYYAEYIDRAEGRVPTKLGRPYWD